MLPDGSNGGNPCGFLITTKEGKKIYDAADTGLFGDMRLIGEEGIDLAILPIGDNYTMGPDDAVRAVQVPDAEEGVSDPLQHLAADRPGRERLGPAHPQGDVRPSRSCSRRAGPSRCETVAHVWTASNMTTANGPKPRTGIHAARAGARISLSPSILQA